jgi:tetratricopeptide (TPR) repeat protein
MALIVGAGGVGKTTLAIHVAHRVRDRFPDGQLYADLRGIDAVAAEPSNILSGFLRALGFDGAAIPESLEERAALYRSLLASRRVLVLLDGATSVRQVEPLLPGTSRCGLIVTSRSLLGVPGARVTEIGTLPMADAVELLATTVGHDRVAAEPDVSQELARLCGGLPLALRIAASRLVARPHWRIADLADRLADEQRRLDELSYGTLAVRASLALSYESLDPAAQTLFRRLGWLDVPGAAAWVSAALLDVDVAEAEEVLDRLIDAHMINPRGRDQTGLIRYDFHDLVRVHARELAQLEDSPLALTAAAQRAFGAWLTLAHEAHRRVSGGDYTLLHSSGPRWPPRRALMERLLARPSRWLEAERQCLLDVVRRAAALDQDEVSWDIAVTSVTLYEAGHYLDDWWQTHEHALATVRRQGNVRGEAAVLNSLGSLRIVQQRSDEARNMLEPALRMFEGIGERHGQALVMRNLAYLDRSHGRFDEAMGRYTVARDLLRESRDLLGEAHVLGGMAQIHLETGDDRAAEALLRESLLICQRIGSSRGESQARHRLGELLLQRGAIAEAEQSFQQSLDLVRQNRDTIGEAYALLGLGDTLVRAARHEAAEEALRDALRLAQSVGEPLVEARTMFALGRQAKARAQPAAAVPLLEQALSLFEALRSPHWQARVLAELDTIRSNGHAAPIDDAN